MMKAAILASAFGLALVPAVAAAGAFGVWENDDGRAHVRTEPCGETLCGKVVWLRQPLDRQGNPKVDWKNPDPELRSRPVMGLTVLSGFTRDPSDANRWVNGTVYDADSGNTYQSTLTLLPDGTAEVRGYILLPVIGRTSFWRPVQ